MQNSVENAKNLANESVKSSVFSLFGRESEIAKSKKDILHNDFFDNYAPIYYFFWVASFALLIASAISEFSFFEGLLAPKAKNPILLFALTGASVLSLEVTKYYILGSTFKQIFSIGKSDLLPFFFAFSLVLSALSMYGSVVGGGKLGIDTAKPIAVETKHDSEIAQIRSEITDIKKRNTWKGNVWINPKDTALLRQKEEFLAKTQTQKETELAGVQSENQANETTFSWVFGGLEIMFWIVMGFVWYFRKRIAVESVLENENANRDIGNANSQEHDADRHEQIENSHDHDVNRMVIHAVEGTPKECKECKKLFISNHKKHRFCSDPCRKSNWERKKGQKLRLKKKKGVDSTGESGINSNVPNPPDQPLDKPKNGTKINGTKPQTKIFESALFLAFPFESFDFLIGIGFAFAAFFLIGYLACKALTIMSFDNFIFRLKKNGFAHLVKFKVFFGVYNEDNGRYYFWVWLKFLQVDYQSKYFSYNPKYTSFLKALVSVFSFLGYLLFVIVGFLGLSKNLFFTKPFTYFHLFEKPKRNFPNQ